MDASRIIIKEDRYRVSQFAERYVPPGGDAAQKHAPMTVPEGQREWAWNGARGLLKQKQLIDSIINGFPIPTCIFNLVNSNEYQIYDGRHRIETIYQFFNDKFEWEGKKYSQLSPELKERFNYREIPVTVVSNATVNQLADMFIRLNKGAPLKDCDLFWANRETELVRATKRLVIPHARLKAALNVKDMENRRDLANWVAIVRGLSTRNAGNMSTSYIRAAEGGGLDAPVNNEIVMSGLDALATLYETANRSFPADGKGSPFKNVGKLSAFFIADWLGSADSVAVITKWVSVIGRLRSASPTDMKNALSTTGAQNLTHEKIAKVIKQVNDYLERDVRTVDNASDDGDEED